MIFAPPMKDLLIGVSLLMVLATISLILWSIVELDTGKETSKKRPVSGSVRGIDDGLLGGYTPPPTTTTTTTTTTITTDWEEVGETSREREAVHGRILHAEEDIITTTAPAPSMIPPPPQTNNYVTV